MECCSGEPQAIIANNDHVVTAVAPDGQGGQDAWLPTHVLG